LQSWKKNKRSNKLSPHLAFFLKKKEAKKRAGNLSKLNGRRFHLLPHPERKIKTHEVASCSTRAFRFTSGQATGINRQNSFLLSAKFFL